MTRFLLLAAAVAACSKSDSAPARVPADAPPAPAKAPGPVAVAAAALTADCEPLPFATSTPVPEASGAAWIDHAGKPALLVISDSGNHGAYGIVDPDTGATLEEGKLPLGTAGQDIEGLAARDGKVYGVTSSGWIRAWKRDGKTWKLVEPAYPLGPVDLPDKKSKLSPPAGTGMVCGPKVSNCGRDYEGLCLANKPASDADACVGFVASRADGHLYCLELHDGKLRAIHGKSIKIGKSGTLADCAFADDDRLFVGANLFGTDQVVRVDGWATPATAKVVDIAAIGVGFPEVIAARGEHIWRMSDTGGAPSLMAKYRCPAP